MFCGSCCYFLLFATGAWWCVTVASLNLLYKKKYGYATLSAKALQRRTKDAAQGRAIPQR